MSKTKRRASKATAKDSYFDPEYGITWVVDSMVQPKRKTQSAFAGYTQKWMSPEKGRKLMMDALKKKKP